MIGFLRLFNRRSARCTRTAVRLAGRGWGAPLPCERRA
jgi:hypothetical protein